MAAPRRITGIDVIDQMTWGTHACLFYETQDDLLDILISYFHVGLDQHEYCLYVAAEPVDAGEARRSLPAASPDFERHLAEGQIEIVPFADWYFSGGRFDFQIVLQRWRDKLDRALSLGYAGLRFVGNPYPLPSELWESFTAYEQAVNPVVSNTQMMGLCTYSLNRWPAGAVLDVVRQHQLALARRNGIWEELAGPELKRAHEEIRKSNAELERRVLERTASLAAANERLSREIAERKQADAKLHYQAQLLAAVKDAVIAVDEGGIITFWNQGAQATYGWPAGEVIGRSIAELLRTEYDGATRNERWQSVFTTGEFRGEVRQRRKDGSTIPIDCVVRVLRDDSGNPTGMVAINRDITRHKQADDRTRREAAQTDALLSVARALNADLNLDNVIQTVCDEARRVMNVPLAVLSLFDEQAGVFRYAGGSGLPPEQAAQLRPFPLAEYEKRRPNGEVILIIPDVLAEPNASNLSIHGARNNRTVVNVTLLLQGDLIGTLAVATVDQVRAFDEAELKLLRGLADEAALAIQNAKLFQSVRAQRERLRVLSARLVEAQEMERRRIARELHDDIGQLLTGLKLTIAAIGRRMPDAPRDGLSEAQQIVAQLMDRAQDLSLELRPAILDHLGLVPALLWHFERYTPDRSAGALRSAGGRTALCPRD